MERYIECAESSRVLVVDDRRATRIAIRNVLEKEGYLVVEAENGETAIRQFLLHKPDVILMDVVMPVMDGLEACKEIKKSPEGKQAQILMFTDREDEHSVEKAFHAGAADFIAKPINWEELKHRVYRLFHMRRMEEAIQRQVYYDSLTNLPNRLLLTDRLVVALNQAAIKSWEAAVLSMNLRNFSLINDAFGYDAGDMILQSVATRLRTVVEKDATLSRMGEDDFVIVLPRVLHEGNATSLAEKILLCIKEPFLVADQKVFVGINIGISLYPNDGGDAHTLIKNAETAAERSAKQKHNTYCFYNPEMNSRALERISMENLLRYAIQKGEFVVYYQPHVNCNTRDVRGVEALVRWNHPEKGMISPMDFIPLAEETGLILPLGEWVLETACTQVKLWHDAGIEMDLSVNISALQFQQVNLVETVWKIVTKTGLEPRWLTLEITESVAMGDVSHTMETLLALRQMGIRISIDDFGTGYSSLNYLKRLPINELKIDRSFVRDVTVDHDDAAIVRMVIALGKVLQLEIVAEGVETWEQLNFLKEQQCQKVQGFLFGKPLPAEEFECLMREARRSV